MVLLITGFGPIPNRDIKFLALRSDHQFVVVLDEKKTLPIILEARRPSIRRLVLIVLFSHRKVASIQTIMEVMTLSISEPRDSKKRPAMVRRLVERRD